MEKLSNETGEKLVLTFSLKNCIKNLYYKISVSDDKNENFETERILSDNDDGIINFQTKMFYTFKFEKRQKINITTNTSKYYKPLKGNDSFDYERITVFSSLVLSKGGIYERKISSNYNSEIISIKIDKKENNNNEKLLFDYLKQGIRFSCSISLDFSKKGKPNMTEIKDYNLNILKHIFQVLQVYTKDHFFHPSGFGAIIAKSNISIFNVEKPNYNIDEIIKDYKNFLEHSNITPNGKILLSPLIKQIIDDIYNSFKTNIYNLLFILISGDIDKSDYKALTNSLILSGHLPLSIIVIGVGNHDFTACKDLFNINNKYSSEGMPKNRDNIIFATLKNKSGSISTVEYCLKELKKQIIEFYQMIRYKEKNEVNVKDSFAKISILFEKNSPEEKGLKESYFRPEEKTPTPDGKFFLPGEDDPYISNNSISNNSNSNNSNSNIQFVDSNNPINKEQNRYVLKDSSINSEPVTPVGSYNYIENSQEEKKEENKKGKEGTSGGSGFNSTKGSDLKESGFSIFNKDNK